VKKSNNLRLFTAVSFAFVAAILPAAGQSGSGRSSSFAIVSHPVDAKVVLTARPHSAFLKLDARPLLAATLDQNIPVSVSTLFGGKRDIPFERGMQIFGWPEWPGLYCDLLRKRGLGSSAACLRDDDRDGRFDHGLRLDFNSRSSDILLVSPSGKIIGAEMDAAPVPLPQPVPYSTISPRPTVTGKIALRWKPVPKSPGSPFTDQVWMSTPENHTGTEGLSERVLLFDRGHLPLDIELYGITLRVHAFDGNRGMQYSVLSITDGTPVPLVFRGYTINFIYY
jgi:hypothetical protein